MYFEDNRVKDLKVAYIGGGSRGWAWGFMMDLAADAQMEGTVALYDIDHEAAEQTRSSATRSLPTRMRFHTGSILWRIRCSRP